MDRRIIERRGERRRQRVEKTRGKEIEKGREVEGRESSGQDRSE